MQDPDLQHLLTALDSVAEWATANHQPAAVHDHLAVAELRLRCIERRLGGRVEASPYLAFVRRLCRENADQRLAAGA